MKVPLLDLKLQFQSLKHEIMPALETVMDEQQFILGPNVEKLEQEIASYCNAAFAVGVNSGSDALLLAMMAMDISPGDKIITTPYTFFATAGSICRLGARPLFVDINPQTYNICPTAIERLLSNLNDNERRTVKAIMPVHLYGQCAAMGAITEIASRYNLMVIEDAAQALGSACNVEGTRAQACSMGDFGCISFFPSKNLGGFGDGGMVTVRDEQTAARLRSLRMHGQTAGQYYHGYVGMNGRLDALQAVVLLKKLPHLDAWAARRRKNAALYADMFKAAGLEDNLTLPHTQQNNTHVFNQFVIRTTRRDELKQHLLNNNIGCAIYYPLPLHLQDCFSFLNYKEGAFPESEKAAAETLALPVYPELSQEQIGYVVETIKEFYTV